MFLSFTGAFLILVLPDEHEEAYKCFPGILMAVRYMKEVVSNLLIPLTLEVVQVKLILLIVSY